VAELTPEVMNALVRLMKDEVVMTDLSEQDILDQMRFGRSGPEILKAAQKLVGEGAAELHRRGWTWPQIAAEFPPINQSSVHRWAKPYLRAGEDDDQAES